MRITGGKSCHCCGTRIGVFVCKDPDGNHLLTCDQDRCTVGYDFVRDYRPWRAEEEVA